MIDNMKIGEYLNERTGPTIITAIVVVLVVIFYFITGAYLNSMAGDSSLNRGQVELLKSSVFKIAYTSDGSIRIFALALNQDLVRLDVKSGSILPKLNSIVVGSVAIEKLSSDIPAAKAGYKITNYFGLNASIDGILQPTNTVIDSLTFVNDVQFKEIVGEEQMYIKMKDKNTPKIFFIYEDSLAKPSFKNRNIVFAEGSIVGYKKQILNGKVHYPIILGSNEAEMMRSEKIFINVGDTITDFFGKDVIIVGVLKKTGTPIDDMHFVEKDFFAEPIRGVIA